MARDADEIRMTIAQLKASGEYDRFASALADAQAAFIGLALARATELSDDAVEQLVASLETNTEHRGDVRTRAEVERAVARYRRPTERAKPRPTIPLPGQVVTNRDYQPDKK